MSAKRASNFLLLLAALYCAGDVRADDTPVTTQIQQMVDDYIAQRRDIEGISGVSLCVSLGDPGPVIEALSRRSRLTTAGPEGPPLCDRTRWCWPATAS